MQAHTFNCPQCGGPIEYHGRDEKTVKCRFCDNTVIVPEALRPPAQTIRFDFGSRRAILLALFAISGPDAPPIRPLVMWAGGVAVILVSLAGLLTIMLGSLWVRAQSSGGEKTPSNQAAYPADLPSPTLFLTPVPTATLSPSDPALLSLPRAGVTHNAEWKPTIQDFSGMRMALVPAGCFTMGSDSGDANQQPAHRVCFAKPFWIGVGEVTQGQFRVLSGRAELNPYYLGDALPRELINFQEVSAFCQRQDGDLPTEAQWEYAERGPDDLLYPWGNTFVSSYVVYSGNSADQTASVFGRPGGASWVGAVDMLGNVYEWAADWYGPYPAGDQTDPTGPASGTYRVLRGGSFRVAADKLTATARLYTSPSNSSADLGFRCARP